MRHYLITSVYTSLQARLDMVSSASLVSVHQERDIVSIAPNPWLFIRHSQRRENIVGLFGWFLVQPSTPPVLLAEYVNAQELPTDLRSITDRAATTLLWTELFRGKRYSDFYNQP